jgi:cell division protein FtsW
MTALSAIVVLCMWALARMRTTHLLAVAMSALFAGTILILTQTYRMNRILAFLDPEKYATTHAYQLNQSLIAIGSGGIFGRGLGMGMQKYHFLSESHTDFIFSIVCEELGFVGAISVVLLFLAFVLLGFRIAYKAPDVFGALTAAGLTLMIGWGVFINLFVVVGLGPTKGLALPFLSYGGSSMIASLMCVGILLNIGNYSFARQKSTGVLA